MKKKLLFAVLCCSILIANAVTLTVTNNNDSGSGSLRQTIIDANNGDVITFDVMGTISLLSPLDISKSIIINGPGANLLALDGKNTNRIFEDNSYTINVLEISGLEIRNGNAASYGGGIHAKGIDLTIKYCAIHSNTITSYGAAISIWTSESSLTIENSSIYNNAASGYAAGIYISDGGSLTIKNSTLYNNVGDFAGQAIFAVGSDVNLENVTIAGHNVGWDAVRLNEYVDYWNPSNNVNPSLTIINCIFDNSITNYTYSSSNAGNDAEISLGYNISNDTSMSGYLISSGDLNNTSALLDSEGLKDNGGTMPTIALQCNSPAIDAGSLVFNEDQIGSERFGLGPDIGALETGCSTLSNDDDINILEIKIYPNPITDFITLRLSRNANANYTIMDINGKTIKSGKVNGMQQDINIKHLQKGLYLLRVNTNNKSRTFKIFKQ